MKRMKLKSIFAAVLCAAVLASPAGAAELTFRVETASSDDMTAWTTLAEKVGADKLFVQRQASRQTLQDYGQLRAVRLACSYDSDHFFSFSGRIPSGNGGCLLLGHHGIT